MTQETTFKRAEDLAADGYAFAHLGDYEETKGYLDQSFAWVIPTVGNMVHWDVLDSWSALDFPMNQFHTGRIRVRDKEVGDAYNQLVDLCINGDDAKAAYGEDYGQAVVNTSFIWTTEHDNVQPKNGVMGLLSAIYTCPDCGRTLEDIRRNPDWLCPMGHRGYDAVSGLYFTKELPPKPMAYGNPENGPDDHAPRAIKEAVEKGLTIEVNAIAMGGALWRKEMFRHVSKPWFVTSSNMTQDIYFCRKAKAEYGARFGVNCAVKIGHIDLKTGRKF